MQVSEQLLTLCALGRSGAASPHPAQLRAVPAANPHQPGDADVARQVSAVIVGSTKQFVSNYSIGLIVFIIIASLLCASRRFRMLGFLLHYMFVHFIRLI